MSFDGSLAMWMHEKQGFLSPVEAIAIVQKAAAALQYAHDQQLIHGNINPSMLLLHEEENAETFDIKLLTPARKMTSSGDDSPINSVPQYMAPEQWNGQVLPATDQYALAILAYELLTGQLPFRGTPMQLYELHGNASPSAPSSFNQRISSALDAVILNALAKRPENRFPSVSNFAYALEQAVRNPESQLVEVPRTTTDGNLRATLKISSLEAITGTLRTIALPQNRRVSVTVPPGAREGQIIRLEGLGDPSPTGGLAGAVLLSITIGAATTIPITQAPQSTPPLKTSVVPFTSPLSFSPRRLTGKVSTAVARLSFLQKMILVGLVLLTILGSIGFFVLTRFDATTPISYPPNNGTLALDDPLSNGSMGFNWPDNLSTGGGTCQFTQKDYQVTMTRAGSLHYCVTGATDYANFVYEVRMVILQGDGGGLIFRADAANNKFYYFRVDRDGSYYLYLYSDAIGTHAQTLTSGRTPAVRTGWNIANLLAVVANNDRIDLYVNGQQIANVHSSVYSHGAVGVAATYARDLTEVAFRNAKVWTI